MQTLENALEELERIEIIVPTGANRHDIFAKVAAVYDNRKVELTQEGHIVVMPPTSLEGGYLSGEVFYQLADWARRTGTGKAFDSSAGFYITPEQNRSPDAAWVSNIRIESIPKKARKRFAPFCPDFAIEVKSPSNNSRELKAKCRWYVERGAFQAWLMDPELKTVSIYSAEDPEAVTTLSDVNDITGSGPLAGFVLDLTPVWMGL